MCRKIERARHLKASPIVIVESRLRNARCGVRIAFPLVVGDVRFWLIELAGWFWCRRPSHFALELILGFAEFADGLAHAAGELRQLLGAKKEQHHEQNDNQIRATEIE